jgi:hypothetical protein
LSAAGDAPCTIGSQRQPLAHSPSRNSPHYPKARSGRFLPQADLGTIWRIPRTGHPRSIKATRYYTVTVWIESADRASSPVRSAGSVAISRLAFKIGQGEWADAGTLADPVQIRSRHRTNCLSLFRSVLDTANCSLTERLLVKGAHLR